MLTVKIVRFDELPSEDVKNCYRDKYNEEGYYNYLLVYYDDVLISHQSDKMAPEDATFRRDLSWIQTAIHDAYVYGRVEAIIETTRT
jgi:hypothetical protein